MNKKAADFFTDNEKERIEAAIAAAESGTSGEIVAMVVQSSDHYRDVDVFVSMLLSACMAVFPSEVVYLNAEHILRKVIPAMGWMSGIPDNTRFMTGLLAFLVVTLVLYMPVRFLFGRLPSLRRFFIPVSRRDAEVREKALSEFREQGLDKTRDATGMLFLVSLFEKRVYVLADHGIYDKIKQASLDVYADMVSKGIANKKGADALCDAITGAGAELAKYFPRRDDDVNELPDRVLSR
ncbi:MAG TPA: hypothetical protein PK514_10595 [Spirochaetota bacterium]|nr:hypothetical protein [Spirochaetota bacterium]